MNERIKELKQQALHWSGENVNRNLYSNYEIEQKEYEKFAQLIVAECAKFLKETEGPTAYECAELIKRHFGIEE